MDESYIKAKRQRVQQLRNYVEENSQSSQHPLADSHECKEFLEFLTRSAQRMSDLLNVMEEMLEDRRVHDAFINFRPTMFPAVSSQFADVVARKYEADAGPPSGMYIIPLIVADTPYEVRPYSYLEPGQEHAPIDDQPHTRDNSLDDCSGADGTTTVEMEEPITGEELHIDGFTTKLKTKVHHSAGAIQHMQHKNRSVLASLGNITYSKPNTDQNEPYHQFSTSLDNIRLDKTAETEQQQPPTAMNRFAALDEAARENEDKERKNENKNTTAKASQEEAKDITQGKGTRNTDNSEARSMEEDEDEENGDAEDDKGQPRPLDNGNPQQSKSSKRRRNRGRAQRRKVKNRLKKATQQNEEHQDLENPSQQTTEHQDPGKSCEQSAEYHNLKEASQQTESTQDLEQPSQQSAGHQDLKKASQQTEEHRDSKNASQQSEELQDLASPSTWTIIDQILAWYPPVLLVAMLPALAWTVMTLDPEYNKAFAFFQSLCIYRLFCIAYFQGNFLNYWA